MADNQGIVISDAITTGALPSDLNVTFPTHRDIYGQGSLRTVDTYSDALLIPEERQKVGMIVYTRDTGIFYTLTVSGSSPSYEENLIQSNTDVVLSGLNVKGNILSAGVNLYDIFSEGGGGLVPNLQNVTDRGSTTTNSISVNREASQSADLDESQPAFFVQQKNDFVGDSDGNILIFGTSGTNIDFYNQYFGVGVGRDISLFKNDFGGQIVIDPLANLYSNKGIQADNVKTYSLTARSFANNVPLIVDRNDLIISTEDEIQIETENSELLAFDPFKPNNIAEFYNNNERKVTIDNTGGLTSQDLFSTTALTSTFSAAGVEFTVVGGLIQSVRFLTGVIGT